MKKSDFLLAVLVLIFLGLVIWAFSTGKFTAVVGTLIDEIWDSIQGLLRPIFRR